MGDRGDGRFNGAGIGLIHLQDLESIACQAHVTIEAIQMGLREQGFPEWNALALAVADLHDAQLLEAAQGVQEQGIEAVVAVVGRFIGTAGVANLLQGPCPFAWCKTRGPNALIRG
jgi:hypothetical protein